VQKRDECNAQRSVTSEGVDKAFWVDAVVLARARKRFKPSSRRWSR
jgi:hypothetical protein